MAKDQKSGGRVAGTPNRRTLASRRYLEEIADPLGFLTRVLNGEDIDGTTPTLTDRMNAAAQLRRVIVPDCRERPLSISLPEINTVSDLPTAFSALLKGVAAGLVTPSEAKALVDLLEAARKMFETVDLEARLTALEVRP